MTWYQIRSDCKICHDIRELLVNPDAVRRIIIGSSEDIKSINCPGHAPLFQAFAEYCDKELTDVCIQRSIQNTGVTLSQSASKGGFYWGLLLVNNAVIPDHQGTGRILDPKWTDLKVLKKWTNDCLRLHGERCQNPMRIWKARPAWVIDVERKCVVQGVECESFVALSYRWGATPAAVRDVETMVKLQEVNSLDDPEIKTHLTPIIWHALYLTSVLGERYLWVDALCIDHHDRSGNISHFRNICRGLLHMLTLDRNHRST